MLFSILNSINETLIGTNGFVTLGQTQRVLDKIVDNIMFTKQRIGDIDNTSELGHSFVNSIISTIGRMDELNVLSPNGYEITGFEEALDLSGGVTELELAMAPSSIMTFEILTSPHLWTPKPSGIMSTPGDFWIDGSKLFIFSTLGLSSISVRYNGISGSSLSIEGNLQNVVPDPRVLTYGIPYSSTDSGNFTPHISRVTSSRYRIDFSKYATRDKNGFSPGHPIPVHLSSEVLRHIDPTGSTRIPLHIASVHKMISGTQFKRLDTYGIYLLSETILEFETLDVIDPDHIICVISFSNFSISSAIKDIYERLSSHSHDRSANDSSIFHGSLSGVLPISRLVDVVYSKSSSKEYAHPQYFSREGYDANAASAYNNIILGDIVVGSTTSENRYENNIHDSRSIILGGYSSGPRIKYRASDKTINITSQNSGISFTLPSRDYKNADAVIIDGSSIFKYIDVVGTDPNPINRERVPKLTLRGSSGIVRIAGILDTSLGTLEASRLETNDLIVADELSIGQSGRLIIGGVRITDIDGDVFVSTGSSKQIYISPVLNAGIITAAKVVPLEISMQENAWIKFGTSAGASKLGTLNDKITIVSKHPVVVSNSGMSSGIQFAEGASNYSKIMLSSSGGELATSTNRDIFWENDGAELYLIKNTSIVQAQDGISYGWGSASAAGSTRVDSLRDWPKYGVHAGKSTFRSVNVPATSFAIKNGVSFDNVGKIFATGNDDSCPPGWIIIEATRGTSFITTSTTGTGCSSIVYSTVKTGDLIASGDVSISKKLGVTESIEVGELIVSPKAEFSDQVIIDGVLKVYDSIELDGKFIISGEIESHGNVTTSGTISSGGIKTDSVEVQGSISVSKNMTIDGDSRIGKSGTNLVVASIATFGADLNVAGKTTIGDSLVIAKELSVNNGASIGKRLEVSGEAIVNGNLTTNGTIKSGSINSDGSIVSAQGISAGGNSEVENLNIGGALSCKDARVSSLYIESDLNQKRGGKTTLGDTICIGEFKQGDSSAEFTVASSVATFGGDLSIAGDLKKVRDAIISGKVAIGSSTDGQITITPGTIMASDGTGLLSINEARINTIHGSVQIEPITTLYGSGSPTSLQALGQELSALKYVSTDNIYTKGAAVFKGPVVLTDTLYFTDLVYVGGGGGSGNGIGGSGNGSTDYLNIKAKVAKYA